MAHLRTQIRTAIKAQLDAALPSASYNIYASRKYSRNHDDTKALVDMRFLNDQTQLQEMMNDIRLHVASLYIRIQRSADEADLDDMLDADEVAVVGAIESWDWSGLLEARPELLQVNFADDASGDMPVGAIVLRYDLEYRIDKSDPETRID